jgi:hypothetical protein
MSGITVQYYSKITYRKSPLKQLIFPVCKI